MKYLGFWIKTNAESGTDINPILDIVPQGFTLKIHNILCCLCNNVERTQVIIMIDEAQGLVFVDAPINITFNSPLVLTAGQTISILAQNRGGIPDDLDFNIFYELIREGETKEAIQTVARNLEKALGRLI